MAAGLALAAGLGFAVRRGRHGMRRAGIDDRSLPGLGFALFLLGLYCATSLVAAVPRV